MRLVDPEQTKSMPLYTAVRYNARYFDPRKFDGVLTEWWDWDAGEETVEELIRSFLRSPHGDKPYVVIKVTTTETIEGGGS